ncbi:pentatricopeptide repeat-containing protein [Canna indica]|uniref:Pentatricopeptide repeat-containing protein n=1 Tax=Canna indica TaxID=4628 RepID=A0AAQ3L097_9LILI|nr:pentatricopeptide repeat-containing protein [Canna indica]
MPLIYIHLFHVSSKHSFIISKPFSVAHLVLKQFSTFTSCRRYSKLHGKGFDKALKILDLVIPRTNKVEGKSCHHRLIQGCMKDLLEIGEHNSLKHVKKNASTKLHNNIKVMSQKGNNKVANCSKKNNAMKEDALLLFLELHQRGMILDAFTLSSAISYCISTGAIGTGVQLHVHTIKHGCDMSIHCGSSLISLYSKLGQLRSAYHVFHLMPVKNVVSWTAIIAGYAQYWKGEICSELFSLMRQAMIEPNDITFVSVLSVCTSSAYLGFGRSIHSLEFQMGFDCYVHVSNALISMYAKCGSMKEAYYVFEHMPWRDLISWNSIISGFSQYGLTEKAVDLLNQMDSQNLTPDAISYLCVLSSCRHAGLVEQGRVCFDLMIKRGLNPELDHYSCIVDLLGRAGLLEEALDVIKKMPIRPNAVIWGSLLSSCRLHRNVWIGIHAAENRLLLEPGCASTYVQLANLYASVGYWNHAAKVRKLMKEKGLRTSPGYSWIEIGNKVYKFRAEDGSNNQLNEILSVLYYLACHMELSKISHVTNFELQIEETIP